MYSGGSMCSQGWQAAPVSYKPRSQTNWALVVLIILLIIVVLWLAFIASNASNTFNFGAFGAARKASIVAVATPAATPKPEDQQPQ